MSKEIWEKEMEMELDDDILKSSTEDIISRTKLLENDIRVSQNLYKCDVN